MFPPTRHGAPPKPKKKMPRIVPRMPMMAAPEMNESPGPEEQEPLPLPSAPGLGRLKNLRAMLMSRKNVRR